jgi:hypothetical protein
MKLEDAVREVFLGASLQQIAADFRQELIAAFDFRPEEVSNDTFAPETAAFMQKLARHLGDRHAGDPRVGEALREWVMQCDHYEAWDALLAGFEFRGKSTLIRRGRVRFPGPLTAHWHSDEDGDR